MEYAILLAAVAAVIVAVVALLGLTTERGYQSACDQWAAKTDQAEC